MFGFSTVNVEYDILVEKRGFRGRPVREKNKFFRFQKKMYSLGKGGPLLRTPTLNCHFSRVDLDQLVADAMQAAPKNRVTQASEQAQKSQNLAAGPEGHEF